MRGIIITTSSDTFDHGASAKVVIEHDLTINHGNFISQIWWQNGMSWGYEITVSLSKWPVAQDGGPNLSAG